MSTLTTQVIILTKDFRIEGAIDLVPGARLTDFMNETNKFIVVTEAMITNYDKQKILQGKFINVLVSNIEIILPADMAL